MIDELRKSLWSQFGAAIDMLENAIERCPADMLSSNRRVFYTIYHTLVFLDYYLTIPAPHRFEAALPFTLKDPADIPPDALDDIVPNRFYTKQELLGYLAGSREKCQRLIEGLTEESLSERFTEHPEMGRMDYSLPEILLYNMRHVQHHAAQVNLYLRQTVDDAPGWLGRAR